MGNLTSHRPTPVLALAVARILGSDGLYITECIGDEHEAKTKGSRRKKEIDTLKELNAFTELDEKNKTDVKDPNLIIKK